MNARKLHLLHSQLLTCTWDQNWTFYSSGLFSQGISHLWKRLTLASVNLNKHILLPKVKTEPAKKTLKPCQDGKAMQRLWLAERFFLMDDLCLNYVYFFCKLLKRRVLTCLAHVTGAWRGQTFTPLRGSLITGNPFWNGDQRGQSTEGLVG